MAQVLRPKRFSALPGSMHAQIIFRALFDRREVRVWPKTEIPAKETNVRFQR
jgi:hypothetical protein